MPEYLRLRFGLVQGTKLDKLYCFKVRWTKNSCLSVSLGTPSLCLHQNFGKCLLILIPPCWSQFVTPCHFQAYVVQQRIDTDSLTIVTIVFITYTNKADLYAGALFITKSTGFEGDGPIYLSILILLAIACLFTVAGGKGCPAQSRGGEQHPNTVNNPKKWPPNNPNFVYFTYFYIIQGIYKIVPSENKLL